AATEETSAKAAQLLSLHQTSNIKHRRVCGVNFSSPFLGHFPLLFRQTGVIISVVSASEIIKELPKLSEAERRAIREGLLEIANQDTDVALCNQTALDGALILDRMEDEDARRQSG